MSDETGGFDLAAATAPGTAGRRQPPLNALQEAAC